LASVNISEKEFVAVASAANAALDEGDKSTAYILDDLARKMNAALSKNTARRAVGNYPLSGGGLPSFEIESPLESTGRRPKNTTSEEVTTASNE
jgi:hypothetical protein